MEEKEQKGGWFLIMVSWEKGADSVAIDRFNQVYLYLNIRKPNSSEVEQKNAVDLYNKAEFRDSRLPKDMDRYKELKLTDKVEANDPIYDIMEGSLKPLNLIGRRKFVIILQTTSNRVLQRLSKMISLNADIDVEIFPATYVTELRDLLQR